MNKEEAYRMGEHLCQLYILQRLHILDIIRTQNQRLKETNDTMKIWAGNLNIGFSTEEFKKAKKFLKKNSPSLAFENIQIKTTLSLIVAKSEWPRPT